MADDNRTGGVINGDGGPVADFFGMDPAAFYGTGAPGTDGGKSFQREAPLADLGSPAVTSVYASVGGTGQLAPHLAVNSGDSQVPGQVPEREPFTGVSNIESETFPG